MIYLGGDMVVGAIRNKVKIRVEGAGGDSRGMILSGFLISASNPYFLLWWAVIGLGFLLAVTRKRPKSEILFERGAGANAALGAPAE